nr:MAG TPA: Alginate and motility regulator [Caudoviricetes sp.]
MSPQTGRPKSSNPKNVRLEIRLTKSEAEELQALADKLNTNKTDVIIRGIKLLQSEHKK